MYLKRYAGRLRGSAVRNLGFERRGNRVRGEPWFAEAHGSFRAIGMRKLPEPCSGIFRWKVRLTWNVVSNSLGVCRT